MVPWPQAQELATEVALVTTNYDGGGAANSGALARVCGGGGGGACSGMRGRLEW
jgi:hypothetical protein